MLGGLALRSGAAVLPLELVGVTVPPVGDVELPRDSRLVLEALLPPGSDPVQVDWPAVYGPLVLRQAEGPGQPAYSAFLSDGMASDPMPRPTEAGGLGGMLKGLFGRE